MARSKQTLTETDRRQLSAWAAGCAEHVLPLLETAAPGDTRPRDVIARARAFADGSLGVAEAIRLRFAGGVPVHEVSEPAAMSAAGPATSEYDRAVDDEIRWQLSALSPEARTALRPLPPLGEDRAGPLGPGMLATGTIAEIIRELQTRITGRATDSA